MCCFFEMCFWGFVEVMYKFQDEDQKKGHLICEFAYKVEDPLVIYGYRDTFDPSPQRSFEDQVCKIQSSLAQKQLKNKWIWAVRVALPP